MDKGGFIRGISISLAILFFLCGIIFSIDTQSDMFFLIFGVLSCVGIAVFVSTLSKKGRW